MELGGLLGARQPPRFGTAALLVSVARSGAAASANVQGRVMLRGRRRPGRSSKGAGRGEGPTREATMTQRRLSEVLAALEAVTPLRFAEAWDNVGLLLEPRGATR